MAGILLLTLGAGCRKVASPPSTAARDEWLASLQDSIDCIRARRQSDSLEINSLRAIIDAEIANFSEVANPREVEPYYMLSSFRGSYPLSSTGIAARMTQGQKLELIAALSGKRFNAIRVSSDSAGSVGSEIVPADQALNYTAGELTTVAFSGACADSIGAFVATHRDAPVILQYLRNGSIVASIKLSDSQKRWIGETSDLTVARQCLDSLEKSQILNARKIELLHLRLMESESSPSSSSSSPSSPD